MVRFATVLLLAGFLAAGQALAQTPAKDQTQLPQSEEQGVEPKPQPPAAGEQPQPPVAEEQPQAPAGEQPDAQQGPDQSGEDLTHIVRHVPIHEIGHHFGLSDADMEAIEAQAEADPGGAPRSP